MNLLNLKRLALLMLSPVFLSGAFARQQAPESTPQVAAVYPNNSQGLVALLNDALLAARNNDRARIQSMIRDMEIPHYEKWFTTTFGQEKGESWAEPYGKLLEKNQKEFEELLFRLLRMEGQFAVHQFNTTKRYDTLKGHLDEYLADWINAGAPKSEQVVHLADFISLMEASAGTATSNIFPSRSRTSVPWCQRNWSRRFSPNTLRRPATTGLKAQ